MSRIQITLTEAGEWVGLPVPRVRLWERMAPGLDVQQELAKAASWCLANGRRGQKRDYGRFLHNWMVRAGRVRSPSNRPTSPSRAPTSPSSRPAGLDSICDVFSARGFFLAGDLLAFWAALQGRGVSVQRLVEAARQCNPGNGVIAAERLLVQLGLAKGDTEQAQDTSRQGTLFA